MTAKRRYAAALKRAAVHTRSGSGRCPTARYRRARCGEIAAALGGPFRRRPATLRPSSICSPGSGTRPDGDASRVGPLGSVVGGVLPAALGADWLTSASTRTPAGSRRRPRPRSRRSRRLASGPARPACERGHGLRDSGTMANVMFSPQPAGKSWPTPAGTSGGWDCSPRPGSGSWSAPRGPTPSTVAVATSAWRPYRRTGGRPGRILLDALGKVLGGSTQPTIVCLRAGNLRSGAFDEVEMSAKSPRAWSMGPRRRHLGWVEGDDIRCVYHGWKFDCSGQCIEQPAEEAGFARKVRMRHLSDARAYGARLRLFRRRRAAGLPALSDAARPRG